MGRFKQTAMVPSITRQTIEKVNRSHTIETAVINPSLVFAQYGMWVGCGVSGAYACLQIVDKGYSVFYLAFILCAMATGYGVFGGLAWLGLLRSFETEVVTDEKEQRIEAKPEPQGQAHVLNKNGRQMTKSRSSKTVAYDGYTFTFRSDHLTSMEDLLEKQDQITRDGVGISGSVWGDVCIVMVGKGLWEKRDGTPHPKYFWTDLGLGWLERV